MTPSKSKKGIILINLGSPDSTDEKDLKKYLDEFLMDERVIDKPWLFRALLVKGIIVPFRAAKSAEAYKKVWTDEGSPLIVFTKRLQKALQERIEEPVEIAMRYGNPTAEEAYSSLLEKVPGLEEVIILPLYPHYAMSSYETAVEEMKKVHEEKNYRFKISFVPPFYNDGQYIKALSENVRGYLNSNFDHILFSFHGVPGRHIRKSDITGHHCLATDNCCETDSPAHAFCYRHQVRTTTRLVCEELGLPANKYSISFQSRLGKGWLTPFTDFRLADMPKEGIKNLLVLCPAFVSDCLETLEEIAMRGKEIFMEAGGESFAMIPCLNTNPLWVDAVENLVKREWSNVNRE
ncbi:MAG: ferrochelatase [Ginsengibacter sp.]